MLMSETTPLYLASDLAFKEALESGRLSVDPEAKNFAGNYMYMGTTNGRHAFKHISTREYLP